MHVLYFWRNVKTVTDTPDTHTVERLLREKQGKALNTLLQDAPALSKEELQRLQNALLRHCSTESKKDMLPAGIEPETLLELGIPVLRLPRPGTQGSEHFALIKDAILRSVPRLFISELEGLNDGGDVKRADRTLNSLIELTSASMLFYAEPGFTGSLRKGAAYRVGTGGSLRIYWAAERTGYRGGWIYNAMVEIINHASSKPPAISGGSSAAHMTVNVSLQVSETGIITDVIPTVAGDESYGIVTGLCSCQQMARFTGSMF